MLFVALFKSKSDNPQQVIKRRLEWQYPQGLKSVAEYWLQTNDPAVVSIMEADSVGSIMAATVQWIDVFDITVFPAVTAEQGIQIVRQMNQR